MADTLSKPIEPPEFGVPAAKGLQHDSTKYSTPSVIVFFCSSAFCCLRVVKFLLYACCTMNLQAFWGLFSSSQSQTPSQPRMTNWMSARLNSLTSGSQVTCYSNGPLFGVHLNSKSPRALDTANYALTRPSETKPPANSILFFSSLFSGLWSSDIASLSPSFSLPSSLAVVQFLAHTVRESPVFAQITLSAVTRTQVAVVPALESVTSINSFYSFSGSSFTAFALSAFFFALAILINSFCPSSDLIFASRFLNTVSNASFHFPSL